MNYSKLLILSLATAVLAVGCTTTNTVEQPVTEPTQKQVDQVSGTLEEFEELVEDNEEQLEAALEQEDGVKDVEIEGGVITAETEEGFASIGNGAELPSSWPTTVPFPANTTLTVTTESEEVLGAVFNSAEKVDVVYSYYIGELDLQGWTVEESTETAGFATIKANIDNQQLDLIILQSSEEGIGSTTTISITE